MKYAIVRDDPSGDEFLDRLVERVDPKRICSGIGEQPAMVHMTKYRCSGYTSGCVCVNPGLSQKMLSAIVGKDYDTAEEIRKQYLGLEDLRNDIHPIRVLHEAVELAGIATLGPHLPLLNGLSDSAQKRIQNASKELLELS